MTDAINFVNSRALAAFRASTTTASGDDRALDFVRQLFRGWEWSSVGGCEDWHDQKATSHVFGYDDVDAPNFGEWTLTVAYDGEDKIRWWGQSEVNGEHSEKWCDTVGEALHFVFQRVQPALMANEQIRKG
tara:strand:+ start:49 stop:441 length:393 start_codon:yes stop_codon:yes gene_type:complete